MTKSLCAGALLLVAALTGGVHGKALAQGETSLSEAQPRISVPLNTKDFGDIWEGEKVTHIFTIRNTGDAELHILRAKGS